MEAYLSGRPAAISAGKRNATPVELCHALVDIQFCKKKTYLVIHDWSSSMDMAAAGFACPGILWSGGSADWRCCSVSTHCERSYSDERKKVNDLFPALCETCKKMKGVC